MRKLLGFALAAGALAVGAAFVGTAKAPSATAAGINCASSAGVAYFGPTTGPVASIGAELRDFSLLYAQQWNDAHKKPTMKITACCKNASPTAGITLPIMISVGLAALARSRSHVP